MELGEFIRTKRLSRGLTQKKLGVKAEIHDVLISNYEKGKNKPNLDTMKKIGKALGLQFKDYYSYFDTVTEDEVENSLKVILKKGISHADKRMLINIFETLGSTEGKEGH